MSRHPKITKAGDRIDAIKPWAVVVVLCLVIAALGPVLLLSLIDLVGRWIR
ncbi:hypothetical protein [Amycolatopsis lurida]|uniref:hypothetical protein n=1 Tax=Amycolatopsis lurida TaxID=31959 RepID=UPI003657318B